MEASFFVQCDMKHYVKPMLEKQTAQIIIRAGTNYLSGNKNPDEIANEIVELAKFVEAN